MIRVHEATTSERDGRFRVDHRVEGAGPSTLWFDVSADQAAMVSGRADAALVALLLPAMRTGRDLHLLGPVTDELLQSVKGPVQDWVRSILPMYSRVTVTADHVVPPGVRQTGVGTGFSAGVDSFSVVGDYLLADGVPASLRVTHLLFNDVGSHAGGPALAAARLAGVRELTLGWDVEIVDPRSNIDEHFRDIGSNTAFMNTHTVRNAAVAHLLAGGLGRWYYASAFAFRDLHGRPSQSTANSDVMSLPMLSTSALQLSSIGSERTRVEKTLQVAALDSARAGLDVCIDSDPKRTRNCSACWKCMQTMLTLDFAGILDNFVPDRFDRDTYRAHRDDYLVTALTSDHPHDREIVELADQTNFRWPAGVRRSAAVKRARNTFLDAARTVKRKLGC